MIFRLTGGEYFRTLDEKNLCTVSRGSLFIFIVPYKNGKPQKKRYLCTVNEGDVIPFLDVEAEELRWNFQLMAVEETEAVVVQPGRSLEQERIQFAKKAGVLLLNPESFSLEMVEFYRLAEMREEAYLYSSAKERIRNYQRCRTLIDRYTGREKRIQETGTKIKEEAFERAVQFLCQCQNIHLPIWENEKEKPAFGENILDVFSQLGIPAREVRLKKGWEKSDFGTLLAIKAKDGMPLVLYWSGKKYWVYDPAQGSKYVLGPETEVVFGDKVIMAYRPFKSGRMSILEMLIFGVNSIEKQQWMGLIFLTVLCSGFGLLLPLIYELLAGLLAEPDTEVLTSLAFPLCVCLAGYILLDYAKNLLFFGSLNKMEHSVMSALYDRLMHLPENVVRQCEASELAQRVLRTTDVFRRAAREFVSAMVFAVMSVCFYLWILAASWQLGVALLIGGIIYGLAVYGRSKKWMIYEKKKQAEEGKANSRMYQYLCGIQKIRTDGMEDRALYEYLKKYEKICTVSYKKENHKTWVDGFGAMYTGFCLLSLLLYAVTGQTAGKVVSFGSLMIVVSLFAQSLADVVFSLQEAAFAVPALERCGLLLNQETENCQGTEKVGRLTGKIEVSHLSFSYPEENHEIIRDISFKIAPGEYIGIVGKSGCGKSTLMKLLIGFEKPKAGSIYYDQKELSTLRKGEFRRNLGVILQEEAIFPGTIYENISVSAGKLNEKQVWQLLEEVGLKKEIEEMPLGLYTLLTETGSTISGGQKQRILLARALAGNPRILYMDEATSSLDNAAQERIIGILSKRKITRIVTAHRLNTVRECDRILVIDEGCIAEEGNYQELMDKKGLFYAMEKRQGESRCVPN